MDEGSNKPVIVAVGVGVTVAIAKFAAAAASGSASMLAEGIHSLMDASNDSLLLVGQKRSRKPPDARHPFGYGKELYFWTTVVALAIFGAGGGVTIVEGVQRLLSPEPLDDPFWTYVVLGLAALLEGYSCIVAYRKFRGEQDGRGFWDAFRESKDPTTPTILFEDLAALAGLAIAFLGVATSQVIGSPYPDAIASLLIGLLLGAVALFLIRESKNLLVGEPADDELIGQIRELVEADDAVELAADPLTMYMGPDDVLLNLDIQFRPHLSADELESSIDRIEEEIRTKHPEVKRIFLEIESFNRKRQKASAGA